MSVLFWILSGLLVGYVGNERIRGGGLKNAVVPMALGVVGAFLAGTVYSMFSAEDAFQVWSFTSVVAALFGACFTVSLFRQQMIVY